MKIASILQDLVFDEHKPKISVLLETETSKEIRIAMKKGQIMKKHQTGFPINIAIFEGSIEFGVAGEKHHLKKGDIISLEANVPHNLLGLSDSVIRLSIAKQDTVTRIEDLLK